MKMMDKTGMKHKLIPVLALAVVCVLLVTAVSAASFTDEGDIGAAYREAVDAMVERGVLAGFEDGSFRPNEMLTREQGVKIITYLCLGKTAAEALRCESAPFDDVAADRWSAPCISWCVSQGILDGYGDGTFGPADILTGDQYAKMLLCALGLANGSYTGDGWSLAVRRDAEAAMLYAGDPAMETDQPITRAQAALLSWNAVKAQEAAGQAPQQPDNPTAIPSSGSGSGSGSRSGSGSGSASGSRITPSGDIELPEVS